MNPIYSELKLNHLLRTASFEKHWLCFCSFIIFSFTPQGDQERFRIDERMHIRKYRTDEIS